MKRVLVSLLFAAFCVLSWADNTKVSVTQVSSSVTLADDVDYHITSAEPFSGSGKVDITNVEHAVLIFDKLKPSLAQKQLENVFINGERAYHNKNCQVRIWGSGSMVLPYTDENVLTMYSQPGLNGESCSDYNLGNTGGFMNTLTAAQLNNNVRSFKLKRGYMLTLANLAGGYGYSRCFIATYGDLIIDLPAILAGKASSYRLFRWNNTNKRGLANDTRSNVNAILNTTSCYSFGLGEDGGMDRECIPHHIYENWPSEAECGKITYSAHMKTNNEPGNTADDHPQTVQEVLDHWEKLMATGMRLCSPSSHDGSLNWLKEFMDSIDARGWRCDIMDVHSYWYYTDWSGNMWNQFINRYKRPIWVSEYLWGASWSANWYCTSGQYTQSQQYQMNLDAMKKILPYMNGEKYIERYFYWNSEHAGSKIYNDADGGLKDKNYLTPCGEYYTAMELEPSYDPEIQFVPKAPRMKAPGDLTLSFSPTTSTVTLKWSDANGELLDEMYVERKVGLDGTWEKLGDVTLIEKGGNYTFKDEVKSAGYYIYRIVAVPYNRSATMYSNEVVNSLNGATSFDELGTVQYGTYSTNQTDASFMYVDKPYADEPAVVFGSVSNSNNDMGTVERIFYVKQQYGLFRANIFPWSDATQTDFYKKGTDGTITPDFSSYLIFQQGRGTVGNLPYEAGKVASTAAGQTVEVQFSQAFTSVPVVFATTIQNSTTVKTPVIARVYDVTTTGCKIKFMAQKSVMTQAALPKAEAYFVAIEQGEAYDGKELLMRVATVDAKFTSSTSNTNVLTYDEEIVEPVVLAQMQTLNRDVTSMLRTRPLYADTKRLYLRYQVDPSDADQKSVTASNPVNETVGYITISKGTPVAINLVEADKARLDIYPKVVTTDLSVQTDQPSALYIYNIGGAKVGEYYINKGISSINLAALPKGVYVVKSSHSNVSEKITKK